MVCPIYFVLETVRNQLIRIGAKALKAIVWAKDNVDCDGSFHKGKFDDFYNQAGLNTSAQDLAKIFNNFSEGEKFMFNEFLAGIRPLLNDYRKSMVIRAFKKLEQRGEGVVTPSIIAECYNARCQSGVMTQKMTICEVIHDYLCSSFGYFDQIRLEDFMEYYSLKGSNIPCDIDFEALMMKEWKIQADGFHVDEAENKVKLIVYTNRIRIEEFFKNFDRLRLRLITDTQFAAGLDNAKVKLSKREVRALADLYRVPEDGDHRICYTALCDEIDTVFTYKELEKMPGKRVPRVPDIPGLAPQRFCRGITYLGPEKEDKVRDLLSDLRKECKCKRISVRSFFEDAANNVNSSKAVGHVTKQQFSQALSSKAGFKIKPDDLSLLIEKFDDNHSGMVNYIAFATEIDPFLDPQDIWE